MIIINGEEYESEEDYLDTLKINDSYSYCFDFEYIDEMLDEDVFEMASTTMNVEVEWSAYQHGYVVSYSCPDEHLIRQEEGNGDLSEIYETCIYRELLNLLATEGIYPEAIVDGGL